jgi:GNAT superfamily N-acetyltransferase
MRNKLQFLSTKPDTLGRNWSIGVQIDHLNLGKLVEDKATFGVWPEGRVDAHFDSIAMAIISIFNTDKAKLIDFTVRDEYEDHGIGHLLLETAERWAAKEGILYLWGDLSAVDNDHFDKLNHFYTSQGWKWTLFKKNDPRFIKGLMGIIEKHITAD